MWAGFWASLASGAAGAAWPWWWDTYIEKYKLGGRMKAAAKFLEGTDLRDLAGTPIPVAVPSGVAAVCSRGGRGAIAYLSASGVPQKGLRLLVPGLKPEMEFRIAFYSPESGSEEGTASTVSDVAGRALVTIPEFADSVLLTIVEAPLGNE